MGAGGAVQSPCEGLGVGNVRFVQWGVRSASSTRCVRKALEGWGRVSREESARRARRCHQRALCNREWQQEDFREPYALGAAKGTNRRCTGGWSDMCGGRCAPYPCGTPLQADAPQWEGHGSISGPLGFKMYELRQPCQASLQSGASATFLSELVLRTRGNMCKAGH